MTATTIYKCPKCGGYMLASQTQKTKNCPYCSAHVNLQKAQSVASAATAFEASEVLRKLKAEKGFSHSLNE